jgi:hypothetical protein
MAVLVSQPGLAGAERAIVDPVDDQLSSPEIAVCTEI